MTQDELCRPQKTPGSVLELAKKIRKAYYERTR